MALGANIRMENLFFTLKEVQNEKVCLEQKLHELKLKRHALEQELDSEILAVAQQKVDQTLTSSLSLQTDIKRNRPNLDELQRSLESEKNLQLQYVKDFEQTLLSISSQLFCARDFYKKSALIIEIENTKKSSKELEFQAEHGTRDIVTLSRCLEKLGQDTNAGSISNFGVEVSLSACLSTVLRDKVEAETYLNRARTELKEIHDILRSTQYCQSL